MPRVTVCMAVYNGAATLGKALDSVFAQTYRDFDVLVLDDGSTDESSRVAATYDCRLISCPNAGLGAARKRLVEEASGELVAFIDHDDFWTPEKLDQQVAALDSTQASLVHSDGWYMYEDGSEKARDLRLKPDALAFDHILPSNEVIASTALFRRQDMLDAGNFVADTIRCSDWYGWLILAPNRKFVHVPQRHVRYSVLSSSLANAGERFFDAQYHLLANHILPKRHELFAHLEPAERARYVDMVVRQSGIALSSLAKLKHRGGHRDEARKLAWQAVRIAPGVPRVWSRAIRSLL